MKLYAWGTPNGRKPLIMLEELGVDYELIQVPLSGDQHKPEFLALNPNGKIPVLVDPGADNGRDLVLFESGAILIYLAEKHGKFLPPSGAARAATLQWLMFQMAGVGPMFGQFFHFTYSAAEKIPYAIGRYEQEVRRLYGVLEDRLGEAPYLAGEYSIADMATWPWACNPANFGLSLDRMPNVKRWVEAIGARPAAQKAAQIQFG